MAVLKIGKESYFIIQLNDGPRLEVLYYWTWYHILISCWVFVYNLHPEKIRSRGLLCHSDQQASSRMRTVQVS